MTARCVRRALGLRTTASDGKGHGEARRVIITGQADGGVKPESKVGNSSRCQASYTSRNAAQLPPVAGRRPVVCWGGQVKLALLKRPRRCRVVQMTRPSTRRGTVAVSRHLQPSISRPSVTRDLKGIPAGSRHRHGARAVGDTTGCHASARLRRFKIFCRAATPYCWGGSAAGRSRTIVPGGGSPHAGDRGRRFQEIEGPARPTRREQFPSAPTGAAAEVARWKPARSYGAPDKEHRGICCGPCCGSATVTDAPSMARA